MGAGTILLLLPPLLGRACSSGMALSLALASGIPATVVGDGRGVVAMLLSDEGRASSNAIVTLHLREASRVILALDRYR